MGAHVSVPAYQRTIPQRYRLAAGKCTRCGAIVFPPKVACPTCRTTQQQDIFLSGWGQIESFTVIEGAGAPPEFVNQARALGRYVVALVRLDEGPRVVAQITDCEPESIWLGMRVKATFRQLYVQEGVIRYGYKFRPADDEIADHGETAGTEKV